MRLVMNSRERREFLGQLSAIGLAAVPAAGAVSVAAAGAADPAADTGATGEWPLSAAERAAGVSPVSLKFAPGDVRRYGADPSGARDSTQAFIDANSVGTHGGGSVRIPSGRYLYAPSATLKVAVSWLGEAVHDTLVLCDTSKFTGEFFRILGSSEMRDLLIKASGPRAGTAVRLAPADAGGFTGHVRLTRLWLVGFDYNIQCDNDFEATFDHLRCQMGNEGFYCAPETGGGNGYATSHLHLNCYYAQNGRNVHYAPSIRYAFRTITFVGGAIENATGEVCQASFTRCSPLKFIQIYLEAAPKIPALLLDDCTVSVDGAYLNGTGGIRVGTNTRIELQQVITTSASDVFSGADGTQQVLMQDCRWPAAGNALAAASIALHNTSINGTTYRDCLPEVSSLGAIRFSRQTTLIAANAAQDVYRFLSVAGDVLSGSVCGRFEVTVRDKGDGSNQALYEYWVANAGGAKHASLVLLQRLVRGTDVGAPPDPLSLAEDGEAGAVKLQFRKNPGVPQVIVDVLFHGIVSSH